MPSHHIHWLTPTTIIFALTAGILFALGHHFFYSSLSGHAVGDANYHVLGTNVSRQEVNTTAGTAFAFLVNFALGAAIATAYAQAFWRAVLRRKATLESLDATFSVLSDALSLAKVWIWWHYPLLLFVALIAWLIPLASTTTPGTLSVGTAPIQPPLTSLAHVPNVGFTSLNYVDTMPHAAATEDSEDNTKFLYNGPSQDVLRVVNEVAATGVILPINAPYPNASWTLEFPGPALQCTTIPQTLQSLVRRNLVSLFRSNNGTCTTRGYFAWAEDLADNSNGAQVLSSNVTSAFSNLAQGSMALNLIALPQMMAVNLSDSIQTEGQSIANLDACISGLSSAEAQAARFADASMLQCQLKNVTYHVSFSYLSGEQEINTTTKPFSSDPVTSIDSVEGFGVQYDKIVNGFDCTVLSAHDYENPCSINTQDLKTLSYQGIFDAFQSLVAGTVSRQNSAPSPAVNTSIDSTILVETSELNFLKTSASPSALNFEGLQQYIQDSNGTLFKGLVNTAAPSTQHGSLAQTMEKLFEHITVSMMSSKTLQPNLTSAFAPPQTTVTLNNYHNVYVYSAARLWLAYGLAIGCTLIAAVAGLISLVANGASYSQDFSTVFRVARDAEMSVEMAKEDGHGADPLPNYLAKAEVYLDPLRNGARTSVTPASAERSQASKSNSR